MTAPIHTIVHEDDPEIVLHEFISSFRGHEYQDREMAYSMFPELWAVV
jgi:hypothetical protein